MMRHCYWVLVIALAAGCAKEPKGGKMQDFFVEWLKSHGETNVVIDAAGVGLAGNRTRLSASLYDSKKEKDGHFVEIEFVIHLSPNSRMVEYLAGIGDTEDQAIKDTRLNFMLTTFHVVYRAFMNPADPHQTAKPVMINGKTREMFVGDIYVRGGSTNEPAGFQAMGPQIQTAIAALPLSGEPHWIKIVYSQTNGKPMTVSATLDNKEHEGLTSAVKGMNWPAMENFYMAKQFVVVK